MECEGNLIFVEFKSGKFNNGKKYDVRKKIYDSVLIFSDIIGEGISYLRENMKYILVYNDLKNPQSNLKTRVSDSESLVNLAKNIASASNEEHVLWGIDIFQNYCFKSVHTYSKNEFNDYLNSNPPAMI